MILFDFEAPGLASAWTMVGGGWVGREACEAGWCMHVKPVPGTKISTRHVPTDWTGQGALRFRAQAAWDTSIVVSASSGVGAR